MAFLRTFILPLLASAVALGAPASCSNETDDNLRVTTNTGTFIGSLNDTYPDVRQFKYVPYAKVSPLQSSRLSSCGQPLTVRL